MIKRAQEMMQLVQDGLRNTMRVVADLAESVGVPPTVTSLLQPKNGADEWAAAYEPPPPPRPSPATSAQRAAPTPAAAAPARTAPGRTAPSTTAPRGGGNGATANSATVTARVAEAPAPAPARVAPAPVAPRAAAPAPVVSVAPAAAPVVAAKAEIEPAPEAPRAVVSTSRTNKRRELTGDKQRSKDVRQLEVDDAIDGSTYLARIIWSLGVASLEGVGPLRPADIARMVMSRSAVSLEPPNVARYIRRSKPQSIAVAQTDNGSNYYKLNAKGKKLFEEHFGASV